MKWIGQHVWSFISRFRDDVYLESISDHGSDPDRFLTVDSTTGKITYRTGSEVLSDIGASSTTGDITAVTAGDGLSGGGTSGSVSLAIDLSQFDPITPADGDSLATLDSDGAGEQLTTISALATLLAGTGLTAASSVIGVDASQAGITTLAGLTSFGAAGATTNIVAGDVTMYNTVNDGNPTISLGKDASDRFEIKTAYNSGAQTLDEVYFNSYTTSASTNDGRYIFQVDEVELAKLIDSGLVVTGNVSATDAGARLAATDTTTSSATQGGVLRLQANDGAAMGDDHRLGLIELKLCVMPLGLLVKTARV